jgi:predicted HicB family RNase H-like nuclease
MMEYNGYLGNIEYDDQAGIFHGEVVNTRDVITFQGTSVPELRKAFKDSIDDYLTFCAERGEKPDKPFSGQFVTRISPDLHRHITAAATISGQSLNSWVNEQLEQAVKAALSGSKIGARRRVAHPKKRTAKRNRQHA